MHRDVPGARCASRSVWTSIPKAPEDVTPYTHRIRYKGSLRPGRLLLLLLFAVNAAAAGRVFTDEPLVAGVTKVKAVHITELRAAINAARADAGLTAATFTDPAPSIVKAIHITEMRTALDEARAALGVGPVSYSERVAQNGVIKAVHVQELRDSSRVGASGCGAITVTNPVKSIFTAGQPMAATFTQAGAYNGVLFSLFSGTLPSGLTLSSGGQLDGSPTATGSFPVTVRATDGNGCTGTGASYALQIVAAPSIASFTATAPAAAGDSATLAPIFSNGAGVVTNDHDSSSFAVVSGSTYPVTPTADTNYTLTVTNAAGDQATSTINYVVPAFVRINEVNANIASGCDLIELRVILGGDMNGIKLTERTGSVASGEMSLTFPAMKVAKNEFIVVHLNGNSATCNPGGATQETTGVAQQPGSTFGANFDAAYDFHSPDTGLTNTDNVLTVFNATGVITEALFVSDDPSGNTTTAASETAAAAVGAANQWSPKLDTYIDTVFRTNAADDLNATGTARTGTSIQRLDDSDTNSKSDWTSGAGVTSTWGALNPGQSPL